MPLVPVVHAVTSDEIVARPDFLPRAEAVMRALAGRGAVQLRAPALGGGRLYALASALADRQVRTGCWLVVTDRIDVALAAGAQGAQLTSRSMTVADARRFAPRLALGASVHTETEACAAADEGTTWAVVSGILDASARRETLAPREPASPDAVPSGVARLAEIARSTTIPVLVIGGVLPHHLPALRRAGASGVAVIRGIWEASDAERAATDYLSAHDAQGVP